MWVGFRILVGGLVLLTIVHLRTLAPPPPVPVQPSLEEQPMESNKDPSDVLASSEVDVNVTTQSSANQGEVPGGKAAKRGRCSMYMYTHMYFRYSA